MSFVRISYVTRENSKFRTCLATRFSFRKHANRIFPKDEEGREGKERKQKKDSPYGYQCTHFSF